MNKITIHIIDDHPMVVEGLRFALDGLPQIQVTATASNAESWLSIVQTIKPDLLLLDLTLPGLSGLMLARQLAKSHPEIRIIVLTSDTDSESIREAIEAGVKGYVSKTAGRDELIRAIDHVAAGNDYFSEEIKGKMAENYLRMIRTEIKEVPKGDVRMSEREQEIVRLLATGLTFREVAERLFISPRTVESHRNNIMEKLNLAHFADLVRYAIRHGIIEP
jgi:DNA-binding NarL/FixJ family response regulator